MVSSVIQGVQCNGVSQRRRLMAPPSSMNMFMNNVHDFACYKALLWREPRLLNCLGLSQGKMSQFFINFR